MRKLLTVSTTALTAALPLSLTGCGMIASENLAVDNEREIAKPPSVGFDAAPAKPAGAGSAVAK